MIPSSVELIRSSCRTSRMSFRPASLIACIIIFVFRCVNRLVGLLGSQTVPSESEWRWEDANTLPFASSVRRLIQSLFHFPLHHRVVAWMTSRSKSEKLRPVAAAMPALPVKDCQHDGRRYLHIAGRIRCHDRYAWFVLRRAAWCRYPRRSRERCHHGGNNRGWHRLPSRPVSP